jgi:hypothetical protein
VAQVEQVQTLAVVEQQEALERADQLVEAVAL